VALPTLRRVRVDRHGPFGLVHIIRSVEWCLNEGEIAYDVHRLESAEHRWQEHSPLV